MFKSHFSTLELQLYRWVNSVYLQQLQPNKILQITYEQKFRCATSINNMFLTINLTYLLLAAIVLRNVMSTWKAVYQHFHHLTELFRLEGAFTWVWNNFFWLFRHHMNAAKRCVSVEPQKDYQWFVLHESFKYGPVESCTVHLMFTFFPANHSYPNLKHSFVKSNAFVSFCTFLNILQIGHAISQNGLISSLVQPLVAPSHEKVIFDPSRQLTMRGQNIKPLLYVTGYVCLFDSLKATICVITPGATYCEDTRVKWELLQLGLIFLFFILGIEFLMGHCIVGF